MLREILKMSSYRFITNTKYGRIISILLVTLNNSLRISWTIKVNCGMPMDIYRYTIRIPLNYGSYFHSILPAFFGRLV